MNSWKPTATLLERLIPPRTCVALLERPAPTWLAGALLDAWRLFYVSTPSRPLSTLWDRLTPSFLLRSFLTARCPLAAGRHSDRWWLSWTIGFPLLVCRSSDEPGPAGPIGAPLSARCRPEHSAPSSRSTPCWLLSAVRTPPSVIPLLNPLRTSHPTPTAPRGQEHWGPGALLDWPAIFWLRPSDRFAPCCLLRAAWPLDAILHSEPF